MIYISGEVLKWDEVFPPHGVLLEQNPRVHRLLTHAESVLAGTPSSLARADAVLALNRAVDQRLRALESIYHLRKLPLSRLSSSPLEVLGRLGVVRPGMLARLKEVRNVVEHDDADPPDVDTCRTLAEFVWYFLRSTQRLVEYAPTNLELGREGDEDDYFLELTTDWATVLSMEITVRIPHELEMASAADDGLTIQPRSEHRHDQAGRKPGVFVSGQLRGGRKAMEHLIGRLLRG